MTWLLRASTWALFRKMPSSLLLLVIMGLALLTLRYSPDVLRNFLGA